MTRNELKGILEGAGFNLVPGRSADDEIVMVCPEKICNDRSGHRSVNVKSLKTYCYKCSIGGNLRPWARRLGVELDEVEAPSLTVTELDTLVNRLRAPKPKPVVFSGIRLPKGFTKLSDARGDHYHKWIGKMAVRKNLTIEDFEDAGAGFVEEGLWEGYCIFPVFEYGVVAYYQGRTYNESPGDVTKKFPSRADCPAGSRHWVYNIDEARQTKAKIVIVVESILNVLSLRKEIKRRKIKGVVPVAIFKHSMSKEQAAKLGSLKYCEEINLMFDADATAAAWKSVKSQGSIPAGRFSVTEMPWAPKLGKDGKRKGIDANDDARLAMDLFEKREKASGSLRDLHLALGRL